MKYLFLSIAIAASLYGIAQNTTIIQIQTVQEGSGDASTYLGQTVTTTGIVTSTIGNGNLGTVYIQQPYAAIWGGIRLLYGQELESLSLGQYIEVQGVVNEVGGETVLESVSIEEVISEDSYWLVYDIYPDPAIFENWNYEAEKYEGMVLTFQNLPNPLLVTEQNADGNNNFGEWRVGRSLDSPEVGCRVLTGRVTSSLLSSLNVSYVNDDAWADNSGQMQVDPIVVNEGDEFQFIRGILSQSFSNHKLLPRENGDVLIVTDDSFEGDDLVLTALGTSYTELTEAQLITENEIITAVHDISYDQPVKNDPGIIVYNLDGTRNSAFGDNGIFTIEGDESNKPVGIAKKTDGTYLLAAQTAFNDGTAGVIYQVLADGSGLDPSFGDNGKVFIPIENEFDAINEMKVNDAGEIIIGGSDFGDIFVIKLNEDGTFVQEFGEEGRAIIDYSEYDNFLALEPHSNGDISLAFYEFQEAFIARLNSEGELINDFGEGGISPFSITGLLGSKCELMAEGEDLILAGFQYGDGTAKHTLLKIDGSGSPALDFANNGEALGSISPTEREAFFAVTRLADGNIAAAGVLSDTLDVITWSRGIMVAIFNPEGELLGSDIKYSNNNSEVNAIFEDDAGMIYVAGQLNDFEFPPSAGALVRFDPFEFLSTDTETFAESFKVFPNPSNGTFTIQFEKESFGQIRVFDLSGRAVGLRNAKVLSNEVKIDLAVPSGLYILEVQTNSGKTLRQKVQVLRK